ncbi:metal cation symporter ZIP14 [Wyeomyia smithii]|uniref:metal cation symporter ZIP14 n=1 Tax=Wyeomyia smithii TaxID=174621 RepID=UPI002467CFF0|nr:metal cation symporter ZIP14 [Wyeomyia smithii]
MIQGRNFKWIVVVVGSLLLTGLFQLTVAEGNNSDKQQQPAVGTAGSAGENKFLKYLFNKYGSKGVISFEGLEHLMHSLGLGGLDFIPTHTLDEHRPEGFKTEDLVEPFTIPVSTSEQKVTVSFSDHQDDKEGAERKRPMYATMTNTYTPQTTEVVTKSTDEGSEYQSGHEPQHDAIIRSSDEIRKLNEVRPIEDTNDSEQRDKISRLNSGDDVDNASSKWHNEVWQEIIFKEIHDPQHRHPRRDDRRKSCLSPMSIVHLILEEPINSAEVLHTNFNYELESTNRYRRSLAHHHRDHDQDEEEQEIEEILAARIKITPSTFKDLCPALLAQIDQRACQQKYDLDNQPLVEKKFFSVSWLYAIICVTIISVCGLTGVAMVPLAKSVAYDEVLRFLVALAVGTLCGDALMHLLPHALVSHTDHETQETTASTEHIHSDEPVWLCFCAFMSALFMYILESLLPLLRSDGNSGHHHGHSHAKVAPIPSSHLESQRNTNVTDDIEMDLQENKRKELNTMLEKKKPKSKSLSPVAFMVILGDGLHNVTDGLAIGAAFAADPVTGMATSFAILCHELPHELGDFALLLQSGVSIRRALALNIVSSILSFAGMFLGLLVTGLHESVVRWIYAGTAGTFLYIALADLVPEMNRIDVVDGASQGNQARRRLRIICSQICGMFLGGMIMLAIGLNEDHLRLLFE